MEKAQEILTQLGGGRFVAMTGAKNFVAGESELRFDIPGGKKVIVKLNAMDLYDITVGKLNRKTWEFKVMLEEIDIYNVQLASTFTRMTGLYTTI